MTLGEEKNQEFSQVKLTSVKEEKCSDTSAQLLGQKGNFLLLHSIVTSVVVLIQEVVYYLSY